MIGKITAAPAVSQDRRGTRAERVNEAAVQFEALLLSQMLKTMREDRGWLGSGDDSEGASMLEMAEEHLAQVLASGGGLGLARVIIEGLNRKP